MASLRCVKTKDILNSDQRTNYLKSKNLYVTATNSGSNDQFIKNSNQCLIATNSYQNRFDISKGHNLVQTQCAFKNDSIQPPPLGKLNEGNFLRFTSLQPGNKLINSTTAPSSSTGPPKGNHSSGSSFVYSEYSDIDNCLSSSDPLYPPFTTSIAKGPLSVITRWDASGVFVDPNRIYVNKESCKDLIDLKDPSGNNYYQLSDNGGSHTDYLEMLANNTRLTNYSLTTKISLKKLKFT